MARIFVQLAHGPDAGAQAHRAFLVAASGLEQGHQLSMFLAGGAVSLLTSAELDKETAFGPTLRDYFDEIVDRGGQIYVSAEAISARQLRLDPVAEGFVQPALPSKIIELAVENESVLTYG